MPFCPDCRYEYEPHVTVCPDCGAALIDKLPEAASDTAENDYVLLTKVSEREVASLEAFLKSEGFHVVPFFDHEGAVMRMYAGRSCFGASLYVPKDELPDAKEALTAFHRAPDWSDVDFDEDTEAEAAIEGGTSDFQKLQRFMKLCFRIVAVLLMLAFGFKFFLSR